MPADWQLPPGVTRALWQSLHDPDVARSYDARLAGTPLVAIDQQFVLTHCRPPGALLDLGCGTGRLSLTLAAHGYRPVGVDLSPEMLRVFGEKARAAAINIPRLCANLVELRCIDDATFDHAACLFGTLGLVSGDEARRKVVGHAFRVLRPGGTFVLHVHNRWFNLWTRQGRRLLLRDLVASWLGRREPGDYAMPPHQGLGSLTMHLFTRGEVIRLLRGAGFHPVRVQPISLRPDGRLPCPWWISAIRSYGYLVAARKPIER
jgi:ubiquinone/menaquinone biosynthesis C-methylase UbiE